jgi:hypothetical protein
MALKHGINNTNIFREPMEHGECFTVAECNQNAPANREGSYVSLQVRDTNNKVHSIMFDNKDDVVAFGRWIEFSFGRDVPQPEWMVYQAMEQQGMVPADKTA